MFDYFKFRGIVPWYASRMCNRGVIVHGTYVVYMSLKSWEINIEVLQVIHRLPKILHGCQPFTYVRHNMYQSTLSKWLILMQFKAGTLFFIILILCKQSVKIEKY